MRFLSEEWFAALAGAVATIEAPPGVTLRIGQIVSDLPDGDVSYVLDCRDGRCTLERGDVDDADVVFESDLAAALDLAQPKTATAAGHAVLRGDVRISGDVTRLLSSGDLAARLAAAIAALPTD